MFEEMRDILMALLDVAAQEIAPHSYLVRDLGMESIDFLELAVAINQRFQVEVHDDTVFLRNLRLHLMQAEAAGLAPLEGLKKSYDFLSFERLEEILADLEDGPVIQVQDVMRYVQWQMNQTKAA